MYEWTRVCVRFVCVWGECTSGLVYMGVGVRIVCTRRHVYLIHVWCVRVKTWAYTSGHTCVLDSRPSEGRGREGVESPHLEG